MKLSKEELRQAVSAPGSIFVYHFGGDPSKGFGADYLGFLKRLMRCLQRGIGFRFGKVTHPRGFVARNGWTDYFVPFCGEVDAPLLDWLNIYQFPYSRKITVTKQIARAWLRSMSCPRADWFMFDDIGAPEYPGSASVDGNETFLSERRDLIRTVWEYNPETGEAVDALKHDLRLPMHYLAMCIRRGDKIREFPYVEIERYAEIIEAMSSGLRTIFVATDDARTIPKLAHVLSGYELVSLTEPHSHGYDHAQFKSLPASERRRRTVRLFAQLEVMRDARAFLGSKTTNVAWLANAHRAGRGVIWVD